MKNETKHRFNAMHTTTTLNKTNLSLRLKPLLKCLHAADYINHVNQTDANCGMVEVVQQGKLQGLSEEDMRYMFRKALAKMLNIQSKEYYSQARAIYKVVKIASNSQSAELKHKRETLGDSPRYMNTSHGSPTTLF